MSAEATLALRETIMQDPLEQARNPALAHRAARHRERPGAKCGATPGAFVPVVDRGRCEGKRACEAVCPYQVFEVLRMLDEDFARLSWLQRLKSVVHGRMTAYTPRADACQACGLCVVACPERAIRLTRSER